MPVYDVIIIGAGPAGCAAAMWCHQHGIKVLVVTDKVEQQHPVDAEHQPLNSVHVSNLVSPSLASDVYSLESIHPGVVSLLEQLGLANAVDPAVRAWYTGIYADQVYTPLGEDSNGPWKGMHIHRPTFDQHMIDEIKKAGIEVLSAIKVQDFSIENGHVVGIKTATTEIRSSYVIDASGKKGFAGKKLNFKRKFYSPALLCWTGISGPVEDFSLDWNAAHFIPEKNQWTWLAPQPPSFCAWTKLAVGGDKDFELPTALSRYPVIGKIHFANMRWRLFRPLCSEGILLCGDAGGILDPAAGQGILNALTSGIMAAQSVIKCLREPALASFHLAGYDDAFLQQFEKKASQLRQYYEDHHLDLTDSKS